MSCRGDILLSVVDTAEATTGTEDAIGAIDVAGAADAVGAAGSIRAVNVAGRLDAAGTDEVIGTMNDAGAVDVAGIVNDAQVVDEGGTVDRGGVVDEGGAANAMGAGDFMVGTEASATSDGTAGGFLTSNVRSVRAVLRAFRVDGDFDASRVWPSREASGLRGMGGSLSNARSTSIDSFRLESGDLDGSCSIGSGGCAGLVALGTGTSLGVDAGVSFGVGLMSSSVSMIMTLGSFEC